MFASRLTVSEETKKQGELTTRQRGELRWKKLKELANDGRLSAAGTRKEVAIMCGYDKDDKAGQSWVNNLVNRGYLTETLMGFNGNRSRSSYNLTGKEPTYGYNELMKKARAAKKTRKPVVQEQMVQALATLTKIKITRNDLEIELELEADKAVALLTNILK